MLSNTLNTNEVKNSAGTEVEFQSLAIQGRTHEFAQINETFSLPHRLTVKHREVGVGIKTQRQSAVQITKTVISPVDNITPVVIRATLSLSVPVGALNTATETKNVLAELLSFCATTGAATTVLFDCSGNGADALINGGI